MKKAFAICGILGAITVMLAAANAPAQEKKDEPEKPEKPAPSLKIGDKAPELKATKWLQGSEVKEFEKGKIYVVEFWATWCGPCIVMMPHMSEMQDHYKDRGVTFIGFSAKDPNNGQEKVEKFVAKRGPKLKYTMAYADNRETYNDWMKAAGRGGIPCSYVVDREGKVAYIGHPMYLDLVIPKVASGEWKGDADMATLNKIEGEINDVFKSVSLAMNPKGDVDGTTALKAVAEFESKYPPLAQLSYFVGPKLSLMLKVKDYDAAKKYASDVMARAQKQDDPTGFRVVAAAFRGPMAKDNKELLAISLKAAELGLVVAGDQDVLAMMNVAESHFAAGDREKAAAYGAKALAAAANESPAMRTSIERQVKRYEEREKSKDGE